MSRSALAALSAALWIAAPAHGAPILSEDFAYDDGALAAENGGTGDWNGAWAGGGSVVSGVCRTSGLASRPVLTAFDGASGPLYFSAEFQKNGMQGITDNSKGYAVFLSLSNNATNNSNVASIGLNKANNGPHRFDAKITQGTSAAAIGFGSYTYDPVTYEGDTVLLVGKIEFNVDGANDRLTVWANPTGFETSTESAVVEGKDIGWVTPAFAKCVSFNLSNTTSPPQGDGYIDNFRVGTTWEDVGPTAPPAAPFRLRIAPSASSPGACDFEWDSRGGKVYDLVSSTALITPVSSWPVYDPDGPGGNAPYGDIPAGGTTTTLTDVARDGERRFFAMVERNGPPLLACDFEGDNGGFTITGVPNDWAWGTPNSDNDFGLVLTTGNGGSAKCWATNLGAGGTPSGMIDPDANSILRSPNIDLTGITGARLGFAAAYDAKSGDEIEIIIRDAATHDPIGTPIIPINTTFSALSGWTTLGPFDLSAADNTHIYLEFRYKGTDSGYIGLYIDDVVVTPN